MYKIKVFRDAHMKVSREQVAEHGLQILAAAARLFRLRGFEGVTVAEVMKDVDLTHSAFMATFHPRRRSSQTPLDALCPGSR
jgi:TetR/AcrR family transcriptional repressor of nem operon